MCAPSGFKFFHFHAVVGKILPSNKILPKLRVSPIWKILNSPLVMMPYFGKKLTKFSWSSKVGSWMFSMCLPRITISWNSLFEHINSLQCYGLGGAAISFTHRLHHWLMLCTPGQYIVNVQWSATSERFLTILTFRICGHISLNFRSSIPQIHVLIVLFLPK